MIQSRIDRIYIPSLIENIGGTTEILPTLLDISDHAGVLLHFNDKAKRKPHTLFFNKRLLKPPNTKAILIATWQEVMDDPT